MKCPSCGKVIKKDLKTCPYCNASTIEDLEPTVVLNKEILKPDLSKTILLNRAIKEEYIKEEVKTSNTKYRKESDDVNIKQIVISIAIGIVIIILIVLGYFSLKK